ncbi:alpha/beta hydrolase [Microbacterium galbinum]|uniref:Alpha/beta hydrolase family protein n=1 Tax=Microbacterium galbinum TaxID=2851646 RepID=A0ABY4INZ5_9MICO|nr:alpha/beta hydrolase [Microbacterium galbinum]UPL13767.1 alpha/beta hydrolase family protein [Microbacterium galbinum]
MAISEDTVAEVVSPANVEYLDSLLSSAQSALDAAMDVAQEHWLTVPDVFQVVGAEGVDYLLDPSSRAVQEWGTALASARTALSDAATDTLPALVTRRTRLLERIVEVNRQSSDADGAVALADAQYWSAYGSDPESSSTTSARESRTDALHSQEQAREIVSQLEIDIETFRRDVEAEEEAIARKLTGISGGDEVLGAWGDEVRVSQTFWGFAEQAYPGVPREISDLSENLRDSVAQATVARINKLSVIDPTAAEEWVDAHPEFVSAVGFIDPAVAARLWQGMASESTRASDDGGERWATGPLAQLFDIAPFAIGNLNGILAKDRDEFNRETLRQTLDDPDASAEQRAAAEQTQKALDRALASSPAGTVVQLVAFEVPSDGGERDMRAAVSVGDLDTAQDVGIMIPGMNSSVAESIAGLVGNAVNMQEAQVNISNPRTTATVAWMGYESPTSVPMGRTYVGEETFAQTGAISLGHFLGGVDAANATAQTTVHAHSYATRVATYALSSGEYGGAEVDHLVLYGSPGIAESVRTVDDLTGVPMGEVYSTKSPGDQYVAPAYGVDRTLAHVGLSLLTGNVGALGVAEMGEAESDIRGEDNVDPNDSDFWGKDERNVFTSDGVLGHSVDQTEISDGYWSRGSDPLKDGALISAGRGGEAR